jgi:3-carboxy-cis,cis-muconate cycloisomerase
VTAVRQPDLPLLRVFGDPVTARLLAPEASTQAWLDTEAALARVQAELGLVPADAARAIEEAAASAAAIDPDALADGMRVVGYPILPLIGQLGRAAGSPQVAAYVHWGATTQDIMDTGIALQYRRVLDRVIELLDGVGDLVAALADDHRATLMAARTHAQPAVPTTFGAKAAVWLAELARHRDRLLAARDRACRISLFGAGGTAAALGPHSVEIRRRVAAALGLGDADVPWHTARDGLAEAGFALAIVAATCGKIAREVIDLSRPEIGELREAGGYHRGASSTMPQKANPIASEVVVGMSSLAAHQVPALVMAMTAGHERAAGEWQIEWDALPLVAALAAGSLVNTIEILDGLAVFPDAMRANLLTDGGTIMAEAVMFRLAPHLGRSAAHDLVYDACTVARERHVDLREALRMTLAPGELALVEPLDEALDPARYLGEVDPIVSAALALWGGTDHLEGRS